MGCVSASRFFRGTRANTVAEVTRLRPALIGLSAPTSNRPSGPVALMVTSTSEDSLLSTLSVYLFWMEPSLLNRMEFPEEFACHHLNPIRYIVREASHPVISATVARSRRRLVGIHQVYA